METNAGDYGSVGQQTQLQTRVIRSSNPIRAATFRDSRVDANQFVKISGFPPQAERLRAFPGLLFEQRKSANCVAEIQRRSLFWPR